MTRRQALGLMSSFGIASVFLGACSGGGHDAQPSAPEPRTATRDTTVDFSSRFEQYEAAAEPNGDISKVIWPEFVTRAGPEVRRLYEFQIENGELMRYMPCFCGCFNDSGHQNNRDCYIRTVHADGSVELDDMAPVCDICLEVTRAAIRMKDQGMSPRTIRAAIDSMYAHDIGSSTRTPYPPSEG